MHSVRPVPSDVPLAVGVKSGIGVAPVQGLRALPAEHFDALAAEFEIAPGEPGHSPPDVRLILTPPAAASPRDLLSDALADYMAPFGETGGRQGIRASVERELAWLGDRRSGSK